MNKFVSLFVLLLLSACLDQYSDRERLAMQLQDDFERSFIRYGVPKNEIASFASKLKEWHPGDQEKIYHSFVHTLLVVNLMSLNLEGEKGLGLSNEQKKLLLLAAAVHDVDPYRSPNTPPRVKDTLDFLQNNYQTFGDDFNKTISLKHLQTLIRYTDFNPEPLEQRKILQGADDMANKYFTDPALPKKWGRMLATTDKASMYTRDSSFATKSVEGLAFELRTAKKIATGNSQIIDPTDEQLLKLTYGFLKSIRDDISDLKMPSDIQRNFSNVSSYFKKLSNHN